MFSDASNPDAPQHVMWNKPIAAPLALFQARAALFVGSNSTSHFFCLK